MLQVRTNHFWHSDGGYFQTMRRLWLEYWLVFFCAVQLSGCVMGVKTVALDDENKDSIKGSNILVVRYPSPGFALSNRYDFWATVLTYPYSIAATPFQDDYAELKGKKYLSAALALDPADSIAATVGRTLNAKFALSGVSVCFPQESEPDQCLAKHQRAMFDSIMEIEVAVWGLMPDDLITTDYQLVYGIKFTLKGGDDDNVIARRQCSYVTPNNNLFTVDYFDKNVERILTDQFDKARDECAQEIVDYILGYKKVAKK